MQDIFEGENHHPYTEGLFGAIPDLVTDALRLQSIPGHMVDPTNLPEGCKFAERCQYCTERCKKENPALLPMGCTHYIKCHKFEEVARHE